MKNRKLRSKIVEMFDTQREFASLINIDETTLSRIIKGRRKPTYDQTVLFVHILKTSKERLFSHGNNDNRANTIQTRRKKKET